MTYETIAVERDGGVTWISLRRPEKLNALNAKMSDDLVAAFGEAGGDPEVRCVVLTGEGRGFCAGQDLSEFADAYASGQRPDIEAHLAETYHKLIPAMVHTPKPVIAAVNGVAAGAGLSLALACDLRVASEEARFTQAFVKIGLVPDSGGTYLLPRIVGYAKALELSMLGDLFDAKTALEIGLVSHVWSAASFREEVGALAIRLAAMPTAAIAETKALLQASLDPPLEEALRREGEAQARMGKTDDHIEGVMAFAEKREPKFTGR